ncbi:hypothetical protein M514_09684 [Trichuris suis]|uniref:Uncharacterized protein n=1 Tax=Trichuris suis TaxID=68888 RepID=A0A085N2D7_9BILA|nr:hypothetical protein M513_09684 [Trichuris suis]KFD63633.1 hypothetical protein M514_09684 [Trichuris suis]
MKEDLSSALCRVASNNNNNNTKSQMQTGKMAEASRADGRWVVQMAPQSLTGQQRKLDSEQPAKAVTPLANQDTSKQVSTLNDTAKSRKAANEKGAVGEVVAQRLPFLYVAKVISTIVNSL